MIVTAQDGTILELLASDGYFTVSKITTKQPEEKGGQSSEVLEGKITKHQLKTYAHLSGLVNRLKEVHYIVEDEEQLEKDLKREDGINRAILGRKFKERNI